MFMVSGFASFNLLVWDARVEGFDNCETFALFVLITRVGIHLNLPLAVCVMRHAEFSF
jgi:hypothetical protein